MTSESMSKRLTDINVWIFLGLSAVALGVGGVGVHLLSNQVERSLLLAQAEANAEQARMLAFYLEHQLRSGQDASSVRAGLQESLSNLEASQDGFLCLLGDGRVLSHPDPSALGMPIPNLPVFSLEGSAPSGRLAESLRARRPGGLIVPSPGGGEGYEIVYQQPVAGSNWTVSVHSDLAVVRQRTQAIRRWLLWGALPVLIGIALLGTAAVSWTRSRYQQRLESLNSDLEERVEQRTSQLHEITTRYQSLFQDAPAAIFVCRPDGTMLEVNRQAQALCEMPSGELQGRRFRHFFSGPTAEDETGGRPAGQWEAELRKEGRPQAKVIIKRSRWRPKEGAPVVLYMVEDVTEKHLLEEKFLRSQRLEGIGRMAGGVAHDFNNLLTAILGYTELAEEATSDDSRAKRLIGEIDKAAQMAAALTRQLLNFSRPQEMHFERLQLNDLISNMAALLTRLMKENITLETDLADKLPLIKADSSQIEQVIVNLAVNAADAMPEGGRLTLSTRQVRLSEGDDSRHANTEPHVLLEVRDTGVGISEQALEHIFEPFFTTKQEGQGTGLGLSTCYGIIQRHKGTIKVDSQPGRGTAFRIYFPQPGRSRKSAPEAQARDDQQGRLQGGKTILVVEDEEGIRNLIAAYLTEKGFQVSQASEGEEALRQIAQSPHPPDLVITDMEMPRMGGARLGNELSKVAPQARILYTSGYSEVFAGKESTQSSYLQKPYTMPDLARKVNTLLGRSRPSKTTPG